MITNPSIWGALNDRASNNVFDFVGSGAPVDGAAGTGVNIGGPGSTYTDLATGIRYVNFGLITSPAWGRQTSDKSPLTTITANGAIAVRPATNYMFTKGSAALMTLAAPTAGAPGIGDDGTIIEIYSSTAFAHSITSPAGTLQTGGAANTSITFNAFAGASVGLMAYNGKWIIIDPIGVSFA